MTRCVLELKQQTLGDETGPSREPQAALQARDFLLSEKRFSFFQSRMFAAVDGQSCTSEGARKVLATVPGTVSASSGGAWRKAPAWLRVGAKDATRQYQGLWPIFGCQTSFHAVTWPGGCEGAVATAVDAS